MVSKHIVALIIFIIWRKDAIFCQPTEDTYSCASELFSVNAIPKVDPPPVLLSTIPRIDVPQTNDNPRLLEYEREHYPKIDRDLILPPRSTREATNYVAYRFEASADATSYHSDIRAKLFPYIRLPYRTFINGLFECNVYNTKSFGEFFVLENFRVKGEKVRIPIEIQLVNGKVRQFIRLPYLDQNNQLFTMQTWIIFDHLEPEVEPIPEYGFFDANNLARVPINAYQIHRFQNPRPLSVPSANLMKSTGAILALYWNPGLCYNFAKFGIWFLKDGCDLHKWGIHTFLPIKQRTTINSLNYEVLSLADFDQATSEVWINFRAGSTNEDFLSRSWNKHGYHFFQKPRQYFKSALHRYQDLIAHELVQKLVAVGIVPSNHVFYRLEEIQAKIESVLPGGQKITLNCIDTTNEIAILYEIHVCFRRDNNDRWARQHCNKNTRCKPQIIYPESYSMVPYFFLSVYRLPSMLYRTRQIEKLRFKVDNEEQYESWYIHSLCPTRQTFFIMTEHNRNLLNLTTDFNIFQKKTDFYATHWPRLTENFWRDVYQHCGLPLRLLKNPRFRGMKGYFDAGTELFIKLETEKWTNDAYLNRFDETLTTNEVRNSLRKYVGSNVSLKCIEVNKRNFLSKVDVCYDSTTIQKIDCPLSFDLIVRPGDRYEFNNCGENLVIPSRPEKIA